MKYEMVSQLQVYSLLRSLSIDPMNCGHGISIPAIASYFKTSKYQVRKHIKELEKIGAVEKIKHHDVCICYEHCECEASGLSWYLWHFKNDLDIYKEHDIQQTIAHDKAWKEFIGS